MLYELCVNMILGDSLV